VDQISLRIPVVVTAGLSLHYHITAFHFSHVSDDLHYRFIAASETEQGKKVNCKVTSGVHDKHVKRTAGLKDVWKYLYIFL